MDVLIVDDSRLVRNRIRRTLEGVAVNLFETASAEEAKEILRSQRFDLITLDIEMPGTNGFELCRWVRKQEHSSNGTSPNVPVIFVTADDTAEGRLTGFQAGASEFVTKEQVDTLLVQLVEQVVNPGRLFRGQRVLVIDDDPAIMDLISGWLDTIGVWSIGLSNAKDAFTLLQDPANQISLIVTDLNLPDMAGEAVCHYIRRELGLRTTPIVVFSGSNTLERRVAAFRCGATDYIVKPFPREEFLERTRVHMTNTVNFQRLETFNGHLRELNHSLSQFASMVAHDLRDPLNTLGGILTVIEEEIPAEAKTKNFNSMLSMGNRTISNMNELMSTMLELGHAGNSELKLSSVCLYQTVNDVTLNLRQALADAGGELICTSDLDLVADPILMRQLLQNLVANALKFRRPHLPPRITVFGKRLERSAVLRVQDNGRGFAPEDSERIFAPFTKLAASLGMSGKGLGLAICKTIVERHQGTIRAAGEVNVGAVFTIELPFPKEIAEPAVPGSSNPQTDSES